MRFWTAGDKSTLPARPGCLYTSGQSEAGRKTEQAVERRLAAVLAADKERSLEALRKAAMSE